MYMYIRFKLVFVTTLILLMSPFSAFSQYSIERCPGDKLNQNDGRDRHAWGMSCFPSYQQDVFMINNINFSDDYINPAREDGAGNMVRKSPSDMDFKVYVGGERVPEWGYPGFHYVEYGERKGVWEIKNTKKLGSSCEVPSNVRYTRICPAGCYSGNQFVLFSSGYLPIGDVNNDRVKGLITLTTDSTLENLKMKETELLQIIKDGELSRQTFIQFKLANGSIEVTPNHPMLKDNGQMVQARQLVVGDYLLTANGDPDEIVDITITQKTAYAYNVIAKSPNPLEKIVVSQGYLTGDLYYQNKGTEYLNRLILRSQDLIPNQLVNAMEVGK